MNVKTSALLVATTLLLSSTAAAETKKVWTFKPDKGFVDDPMAFDAKDAHFAYVHTDMASFLKVVVIKTAGFKPHTELVIADTSIKPQQLLFSEDSKRLVLIFKDAKGTRGAMVWDLERGKLLKRFGPYDLVETVRHKGAQCLSLTRIREDKRGNKHHTVEVIRTANLRRAARAKLTVQAGGRLTRPQMRVRYWEPGHLTLVGTRQGKYDKKRDIRLPDVAIRYDLLTKKETWKYTPQKLMDWSLTMNTLRPSNRGSFRFLAVSDDLKKLYYVDRNNGLNTMTLPVQWVLYEHTSLKHAETWDREKLYFSMTIDPVNKPAVKRKKADIERVDLYRLDAGPKATPVGQVLTGRKRGESTSRRFTWKVGQGHFSYLYKLKGFGRGGSRVTIYKMD